MPSFAERVDAFFGEYFDLQPVEATGAGAHDRDGAWPDLSPEGGERWLDFVERWSRELSAFPNGALTAGERLDRDLLLGELAAARFAEVELQAERWDPLSYVYLIGAGIFPLLSREYAPLGERLRSAALRLEGIPALVSAARANLARPGPMPVSRLHTETALRQLDGIGALCDEAIQAAAAARDDPDVASVEGRLGAAAETARTALAELRAHLADEVLPRSAGEGRLGRDLFDRKLRHTLRSELTSDEVLRRAEVEYEAIRAEMVRLARELWPSWVPGRSMPEAAGPDPRSVEAEIVREVLAAIGAVHHRPEELLDFCREELGRIEAFVRARDLITLSQDPLEIVWTPLFLRSSGGAMLVPPGPLESDQRSFFCITPPPAEWTAEQVESALREDNDRMLRLLTIHEAVPGHYLQLAHANRASSLARSVFRDGVFAEGWAVYVTQVMLDEGYGADDPALLLTHWKFYLRGVINAIIDVRIHRGEMAEDQAVRLMVEGGFQEESEARAKWDRARLTSTQLSTYFVGSSELWRLEREWRQRVAAASGAVAIPEPRIVGGLGKTPGFRYREYLDGLLSHGTLPIALVRRAVLGE